MCILQKMTWSRLVIYRQSLWVPPASCRGDRYCSHSKRCSTIAAVFGKCLHLMLMLIAVFFKHSHVNDIKNMHWPNVPIQFFRSGSFFLEGKQHSSLRAPQYVSQCCWEPVFGDNLFIRKRNTNNAFVKCHILLCIVKCISLRILTPPKWPILLYRFKLLHWRVLGDSYGLTYVGD